MTTLLAKLSAMAVTAFVAGFVMASLRHFDILPVAGQTDFLEMFVPVSLSLLVGYRLGILPRFWKTNEG